MPKIYDYKFRKQVMERILAGDTPKQLRERFGISTDTFQRWKEQIAETGNIKPKLGKNIYPYAFRKIVMQRIENGERVKPLCRELGISFDNVYKWRKLEEETGSFRPRWDNQFQDEESD